MKEFESVPRKKHNEIVFMVRIDQEERESKLHSSDLFTSLLSPLQEYVGYLSQISNKLIIWNARSEQKLKTRAYERNVDKRRRHRSRKTLDFYAIFARFTLHETALSVFQRSVHCESRRLVRVIRNMSIERRSIHIHSRRGRKTYFYFWKMCCFLSSYQCTSLTNRKRSRTRGVSVFLNEKSELHVLDLPLRLIKI